MGSSAEVEAEAHEVAYRREIKNSRLSSFTPEHSPG